MVSGMSIRSIEQFNPGEHKLKQTSENTIGLGDNFFLSEATPGTDDWLAMGRLRSEVYVYNCHFLGEDAIDENGAEYDEYDEFSKHFIAKNEIGEVVGTVRVVSRDAEGLLPGERLFDASLPEVAHEISRIMVTPDYPVAQKPLLSMLLMRAALKETDTSDAKVCAVVEENFRRYLSNIIGIETTEVAPRRMIEEYNTENILVTMHPRRITSQVHSRDDRPRLRGFPEKLAPAFEQNATERGLGRVSLSSLMGPNFEQFNRNLGFMNYEELIHLSGASVAIAGVGGDGGELAITLAQMGVGNFRLADPEVFEVGNLNRQAGASYKTLGRNKADVIAEQIKDINPYAQVAIYTEGVNEDNISEFIAGSNLVIDETEFTTPEIGTMIAREARGNNLPVLMAMNVGFGSYVTSFSPDGVSFEKYLGLSEKMTLEEIKNTEVPIYRWVPHVPSYSDMNIFAKVASGSVSTPSVAPGVKMAAADASVQAMAHLLKDITPQRESWIRYAPKGRSFDAIDGVHNVRSPRLHFGRTALKALMRTHLKINPPAGY